MAQSILRKNRIQWVDTARFLCLFFIMIHHVGYIPEVVAAVYMPFFLSVFFFVSGYVYKRTGAKQFFTGRLLHLLLPWAIYGLIMVFFNAVTEGTFSAIGESIGQMFLQVRMYGDKLWFVACLFAAEIPFYFVERYLSRKRALIVLGVLTVASAVYMMFMPAVFPWGSNLLPWHLQLVFPAALLMYLGLSFRGKAEEAFNRFVKAKFVLPVLVLYIAVCVLLYFGGAGTYSIEALGAGKIWCIPVWLAMNAFGVGVAVALAKWIKPTRAFAFVGQNTFLYYAFHINVEGFLSTIFRRVIFHDTYQDYTIIVDYVVERIFTPGTPVCNFFNNVAATLGAVFAVLLTMVILALPIIFINRFLPFTLGRKYEKKEKKQAE